MLDVIWATIEEGQHIEIDNKESKIRELENKAGKYKKLADPDYVTY